MKNMFYIPTDRNEIKELMNQIIERNKGNIDLVYIMLLASEFTEKHSEVKK